ncbi:MAG: (Na+)-NQR maturation NqrM [Planctomycetaceae bacterium]
MSPVELLIIIGIVAAVFGLVIVAMAVGVIFSNRRIQGSCGGLSTMRDADGKSSCMACGGSPADCDEAQAVADSTDRD